MFIYDSEEYNIQWKKDGKAVSNEVFLEGVCDDAYSVMVSSESEGKIGTAKYRSNADCKTSSLNKIF